MSARVSKSKRTNEFRHHMGRARVWLRNARDARDSFGMRTLAADFIAKARTDRAAAFAWLRGAA